MVIERCEACDKKIGKNHTLYLTIYEGDKAMVCKSCKERIECSKWVSVETSGEGKVE